MLSFVKETHIDLVILHLEIKEEEGGRERGVECERRGEEGGKGEVGSGDGTCFMIASRRVWEMLISLRDGGGGKREKVCMRESGNS